MSRGETSRGEMSYGEKRRMGRNVAGRNVAGRNVAGRNVFWGETSHSRYGAPLRELWGTFGRHLSHFGGLIGHNWGNYEAPLGDI